MCRILILEDNEHVRTMLYDVYTTYGFNVVATARGEDTIEQYRNAGPFDVVSLDLKIEKGMDGIDTMKALREINPNVKAIVFSGYHESDIMYDYKRYGFKAAFHKPGDIPILVTEVKKIIESN